jgi:hypothetical protein
MGEHENLVVEEITENVDAVSTEEVTGEGEQNPSEEKVYTESEFNQRLDELLGKKIARKEAKIRKEYEQKYGELETVLKAGTGKQDVSEVTKDFRQFYEGRGVKIPSAAPEYSNKDIEVLAHAEASEIIAAGLDEVIDETERLGRKGVSNMTAREKALFKSLAEYRKEAEAGRELAKIGVTEDVYASKEFKDFASKFDSRTPITEVYGIYAKTKPKKEVETMGSMKSSVSNDSTIKDFYTPEEAKAFKKADYDKNPGLLEAIEKSMRNWGKKK